MLLLTDMLLIFQEAVDYRRQGASGSQPGELRGRKIMRLVIKVISVYVGKSFKRRYIQLNFTSRP